jgi:hypothetical protein
MWKLDLKDYAHVYVLKNMIVLMGLLGRWGEGTGKDNNEGEQ